MERDIRVGILLKGQTQALNPELDGPEELSRLRVLGYHRAGQQEERNKDQSSTHKHPKHEGRDRMAAEGAPSGDPDVGDVNSSTRCWEPDQIFLLRLLRL